MFIQLKKKKKKKKNEKKKKKKTPYFLESGVGVGVVVSKARND